MSLRELEMYQQTMKNFTQAMLIFDKRRKSDEDKLDSFLETMQTVFAYLDSLENVDLNTLMTKQISPKELTISIELVADASEEERGILKSYRELLINRLNSYTKNKKLIYDILLRYFMQFLNCFEQHSNVNLQIERMMLLSALGMQSQSSESFLQFIQGPLAQVIDEKKHELERAMKNHDSDWKKGTVG